MIDRSDSEEGGRTFCKGAVGPNQLFELKAAQRFAATSRTAAFQGAAEVCTQRCTCIVLIALRNFSAPPNNVFQLFG